MAGSPHIITFKDLLTIVIHASLVPARTVNGLSTESRVFSIVVYKQVHLSAVIVVPHGGHWRQGRRTEDYVGGS